MAAESGRDDFGRNASCKYPRRVHERSEVRLGTNEEVAAVNAMVRGVMLVITLPTVILSACSEGGNEGPAGDADALAAMATHLQPDSTGRPAGDQASDGARRAAADSGGEWTLPARDEQGTRYSPLARITTENACRVYRLTNG